MLLPKRVKYRRQHRPKTTGRSKGGNYVHLVSLVYKLQQRLGSHLVKSNLLV